MMLGRLAIGSSIALACAIGCAKEPRPHAPTSSAKVIGTARVPAGTMFTVRMIDPLSSETAVPGRVFTARLRDPLIVPNGREIAPAGGIVTGRIVAVQRGDNPRLALAFETLETYEGVAAISTRAEPAVKAPVDLSELRPGEAGADLVLRPKYEGAIGGGPSAESGRTAPSVNVPKDTELDLFLTQPLVFDRTK